MRSPVNGIDYTATLAGLPGGPPVQDVRLTNVSLTLPGGHPAADATIVPPENSKDYNPNSFGVRPAYGWWMRQVSGIGLVGCSVRFENDEGRPAVQATNGAGILLDHFVAQAGSTSPYDIGFDTVTGQQVIDAVNTNGAPLRVNVAG